MEKQRGFTLIELSIVLVIISLLVGGVLVGRDLIEVARIRATISQLEQFKTAINTFRLKYNGLPGDITQAQAAAFNFQPTSRPSTSGYGGKPITRGNYLLEPRATVYGWENLLFWRDLASANLIPGTIDAATDAPIPDLPAPYEGANRYLPEAKMGNRIYWMVFNYPAEDFTANMPYAIPIEGGNYFLLAGIYQIGSGVSGTLANDWSITPQQAFSIDSKIDDGSPLGGRVLGSNHRGGPLRPIWYHSGCMSGDPDWTYRIATGANAFECSLSFKM